jgi:hypothetical protein
VFAVLAMALSTQQQANNPSPETSPQVVKPTTSKPRSREPKSIKYRNTKYGFTFSLPATWKGYSAVESTWDGGDNSGPHGYEVSERGPEITLRNPQSTSSQPYQDIFIMVFSHAQWDSLEQGNFSVTAAPVGPGRTWAQSQIRIRRAPTNDQRQFGGIRGSRQDHAQQSPPRILTDVLLIGPRAMDSIPIPRAEIYCDEQFLTVEEATQFFDVLMSKCAWERAQPRLVTPYPAMRPTMAIPKRITRTRDGSTNRSLGYRNCLWKEPLR